MGLPFEDMRLAAGAERMECRAHQARLCTDQEKNVKYDCGSSATVLAETGHAFLLPCFIGNYQMSRLIAPLVTCFFLFSLVACDSGPTPREVAEDQVRQAETALAGLGKVLSQPDPNALYPVVLRTYASKLGELKPEFADIAAALGKEATPEGQTFRALGERIALQKQQLGRLVDPAAIVEVSEELEAVRLAAQPDFFFDGLVDPINVLADLSGGQLPRIALPQTNEPTRTDAKSVEHLVGNPSYGHWNSSGIWTFIGAYALMNQFTAPNPYRYGGWFSNRGPSHYNDVGRYYHAPKTDQKRWAAAEKRFPNAKSNQAKTFSGLQGTRRLSTYAPATAPKNGFQAGSSLAGTTPRRTSVFARSAQSTGTSTRRTSSFSNTRTRRTGGFGGFGGK